jgi:hypothetical protein
LSSFLNPDPLSEVPFRLSQIEQEKEARQEAEGMDSPSDLDAASDFDEPQSVIDTIEPPMPDGDAEPSEMEMQEYDPVDSEVEMLNSFAGNELPIVETSALPVPMNSAIDCGVVATPVCVSTCSSAVVYGCCETTTTTCCETTCCETTCCETPCCANACSTVSDCCGATRACNRFRRPGILRRLLGRLASCRAGCR